MHEAPRSNRKIERAEQLIYHEDEMKLVLPVYFGLIHILRAITHCILLNRFSGFRIIFHCLPWLQKSNFKQGMKFQTRYEISNQGKYCKKRKNPKAHS